MSSPLPATTRPESTEETLRLKCPGCEGGLNLKRRHIGITGQCVHCQSPLTALEEEGRISVILGAPVKSIPAVEVSPTTPEPGRDFLLAPAPANGPVETNSSMWNFPEPKTGTPDLSTAGYVNPIPSDFSTPPASSENGSFLVDRHELPDLVTGTPIITRDSSLFDTAMPFQSSISSMFKNDDDSAGIHPAWGTKIPQETHASISPFSTGSAGGGGFAETLFREKGAKAATTDEPLLVSSILIRETGTTILPDPAPAPVGEECEKRVTLDGDGRSMVPMTKEEEANFAKHLFAIEKARNGPKWVKRLIRLSITLSVMAAIATVAYFLIPEEKLGEWKEKAYVWLEPGLAILDYLPEGMRPDWLPRTDLGIDAGVDENGVPKKKLNAFEGLKKLDGDIGDMRGAAEDELKSLNRF